MKKLSRQLAAFRQKKEALMPQITQLALEGHSCREIAKMVGVGKSAVSRWLQELRRNSLAQESPEAAEMTAKAASRLDFIYRKAIQGFNASQADKRIHIVEETVTAGDDQGAKKKKSTRIETQAGDARFLAEATDATKEFMALNRRAAPRRTVVASPRGGPIDLAALSDDDLDNMTDAQLYAIETRLLAENGPVQSALTPADLDNMTDEQLSALEAQLLAEINN